MTLGHRARARPGRRRARAAAAAEHAQRHVRQPLVGDVPGKPRRQPALRRRSRGDPDPRAADRSGRDQGPRDAFSSSRRASPARCWSPTSSSRRSRRRRRDPPLRTEGGDSPCGKLMKARPAQVVYGPGTFLNRAVAAVNTEIAQIAAAAQQTIQTAKTSAYQLALARHLLEGQGDGAGERGWSDRPAAGDDEPAPDVPELGHLRSAEDRRPAVHPGDRVRPDAGRRTSPRRGSPTCSRPRTRR